ncbi:HAD-IA family hydrolase [Rhodococcus sp. NPDC019627]|uniref:HAD-IA family hydrolase n=1 Tax=Rhodococcus TaxID=1827 RepID=UPI00131FEE9A|nr:MULTISPECIES: HAD-IA family hydrolase [Rhodococcus]MDV7355085.1 HAD-IA family hydrolase [Rhodococcus oxybenzonivorans]QHE69023.1 Phosphoglycolate phosphatase [Rhodococcus sp. WAY2]
MTSLSTAPSALSAQSTLSAPSALSAPIVLFDLDGTLTDSAPGIHGGFRHALATIGQPEPTPEMLDNVIGPPMIDTFRSLGLDEADVQRALTAYFDRYDSVGWAENSVFDGIADVLAGARDSGRRLAVATSKSERFAVRILEHFELAHYFEFIGGASNDGQRRAKADVIAHSLQALGVSATEGATSDVLMIGDRDHDVLGAARWGIPAVFVEWGYGSPAEASGAHRSARTVTELGKMLDGAA